MKEIFFKGHYYLSRVSLKINEDIFLKVGTKKFLIKLLKKVSFVQENHSISKKVVPRGMHFEIPSYEQSKLVRCLSGSIFDVIVDLRKTSKTFGERTNKHALSRICTIMDELRPRDES